MPWPRITSCKQRNFFIEGVIIVETKEKKIVFLHQPLFLNERNISIDDQDFIRNFSYKMQEILSFVYTLFIPSKIITADNS